MVRAFPVEHADNARGIQNQVAHPVVTMNQSRRARLRPVPLQPANAQVDRGMMLAIAIVARDLGRQRIQGIGTGGEKRQLGHRNGMQPGEDFAGLGGEALPGVAIARIGQERLGQGFAGNAAHGEAAIQAILGVQFEHGLGNRQPVAMHHLKDPILVSGREERRNR